MLVEKPRDALCQDPEGNEIRPLTTTTDKATIIFLYLETIWNGWSLRSTSSLNLKCQLHFTIVRCCDRKILSNAFVWRTVPNLSILIDVSALRANFLGGHGWENISAAHVGLKPINNCRWRRNAKNESQRWASLVCRTQLNEITDGLHNQSIYGSLRLWTVGEVTWGSNASKSRNTTMIGGRSCTRRAVVAELDVLFRESLFIEPWTEEIILSAEDANKRKPMLLFHSPSSTTRPVSET